MVHGGFDAATTFDLYQLHKSFGFVVLALTAARLLARAAFTAPAAAPKSAWEQRLAALVQASLYALTLAAILAGWLVVSTSPLPIPTRFFNLFVIPNIAAPDGALFAARDARACAHGLCHRRPRRAACRRRAEAPLDRSRRRADAHAAAPHSPFSRSGEGWGMRAEAEEFGRAGDTLRSAAGSARPAFLDPLLPAGEGGAERRMRGPDAGRVG